MLRHIPTGLLIWTLPISGGMDASIGREIDRRAVARELSPEQWVRLLDALRRRRMDILAAFG